MKVKLKQDGDGILLSIENIVTNSVSPIFIKVPDATQNFKNDFTPVIFNKTRNFHALPLTKSSTYTITPTGILTEFLGKHSPVGGDNKAPFAVMAPAAAKTQLRGITADEVKRHNNRSDC